MLVHKNPSLGVNASRVRLLCLLGTPLNPTHCRALIDERTLPGGNRKATDDSSMRRRRTTSSLSTFSFSNSKCLIELNKEETTLFFNQFMVCSLRSYKVLWLCSIINILFTISTTSRSSSPIQGGNSSWELSEPLRWQSTVHF